MKIICAWCKKVLGEKEPFNDSSETHARCAECLEKQKREKESSQKIVATGKEYITEGGIKGFLTVAGKETEVLNLGEMVVSGKKFICTDQNREELEIYLNGFPGDEVEMTSLHSTVVTLPSSVRGVRKKGAPKVEEKPTDAVTYNFTARVPKGYVLACYDLEKDRIDRVAKLLAEMAFNAYLKENGPGGKEKLS